MKTINKTKYAWIGIVAVVMIIAGLVAQFITDTSLFSSGDFAMNYFASGQFACGVFAAGTFSVGIFSAGIFSFGIFSIGIFNVGLFAIGLFVAGYRKRKSKQLSDFQVTFK